MAKKKQRRRRSKERRHEWEYVYLDDEGHEVEAEEEEAQPKPRKEAKATAKQPARGAGRQVDPPSWRRVGKRALIFAPLMLVVVYLIQGSKHDYPQAIVQTLVLLAFFMPFSYFMDSLLYRSYRKRLGASGGKQPGDAKRR